MARIGRDAGIPTLCSLNSDMPLPRLWWWRLGDTCGIICPTAKVEMLWRSVNHGDVVRRKKSRIKVGTGGREEHMLAKSPDTGRGFRYISRDAKAAVDNGIG